MASGSGVYFPGYSSLVRSVASKKLVAKDGTRGFYEWVSLMCWLLDQPGGIADVSDDVGMGIAAEELRMGPDDLRDLLHDLSGLGLVDADALGDGTIRCPLVDEGMASYEKARRGGRRKQ